MTRHRLHRLFGGAWLACAVLLCWPHSAHSIDPRRWGADALPVRQGHHIEWWRNAARRSDGSVLVVWSDTRTGNRDVYGQLITPNGQKAWDSTGHPLISLPRRQEDPDMVAVNGGWVVAWIDFREDSAGDVWAQKVNDAGQPLWNPVGVQVDAYPSMVNEMTVRVADDGAGGVIVAWEDNRRNDAGDIYAQRITSAGTRAWAQALAVTDTAGGQTGITADGDGNGNMLVAWNDLRAGTDQNVFAAKVTSDGQLPWGRNGQVVCDAELTQQATKLCPDGTGGCYIAWADARNGASDDLYIQHLNGAGNPQWTVNGIPLCDAPNMQEEVRVAVSLNGGTPDGVIAIWQDLRTNASVYEVYAQKLNPQGTPVWPANGVLVCGDADPDGSGNDRKGPRLTSDLQGGLICAWEDARADGDIGKADLFAGRVLANGTLGWNGLCGRLVAGGHNAQTAPIVRMDSGDGAVVIFDDLRAGSQDLRYQNVSLATGDTTLVGDLCHLVFGLDGDADKPQTAAMGGGQVGIAWQDGRRGGGNVLIYYQIVDSLNAHVEKPLNGVPLAPDGEGYNVAKQESLRVCRDGQNGFFVTWEDLRTGTKRIRLARVNSAGEIACSQAGNIVYENSQMQDQISAYCAPDGSGGCFVAWSSYSLLYEIDVYVMHMDSTCQRMWTDPVRLTATPEDDMMLGFAASNGCCMPVWRTGPMENFDILGARVCADGSSAVWNVCDAPNGQDLASVAADGQGGGYFAWSDQRNMDLGQDVWAQHFDAQGVESWPHNGVVVISDSLNQSRPVLSVDGHQNLFAVWEDFRNGNDVNVYAQKLSPSGTRLWPTAGKLICNAPGEQAQYAVFTEWANGQYILWADYRGLFYDIYGTHLNSAGDLADGGQYWHPDSGGVICNYYEHQTIPSMADDGSGGVIAAWVDNRASGKEPLKNIWVQRINDDCADVVEVSHAIVPREPQLSQNYPNPFNPTTNIAFALPRRDHVQIEVFNTLGQKVKTLVDGVVEAGQYEIRLDADRWASGLYFYRMRTTGFVQVKKMALLR